MTRWLTAARAALPLPDKTDTTDETTPARVDSGAGSSGKGVLSVSSVLSEGPSVAPTPDTAASREDLGLFAHGRCGITGEPRTWTGRVVSIEQWKRLSEWDRHGSTDKLWNGITRQWEPKC